MSNDVTEQAKIAEQAKANLDQFLAKASAIARPSGRLVFGVDATASREPTWKLACEITAQMFRRTAPVGKLSVQLVAYGGDWCKATPWKDSGAELAALMPPVPLRRSPSNS